MDMTFPLRFRREAFAIARDRGERQRAAAEDVRHGTIARVERAVDLNGSHLWGVADLLDRDAVGRPQKDGARVDLLAAAEHVARPPLPLPLGDHPVLDSDP